MTEYTQHYKFQKMTKFIREEVKGKRHPTTGHEGPEGE